MKLVGVAVIFWLLVFKIYVATSQAEISVTSFVKILIAPTSF